MVCMPSARLHGGLIFALQTPSTLEVSEVAAIDTSPEPSEGNSGHLCFWTSASLTKLSELPVSTKARALLPLIVMEHTAFSKQRGDAALTEASKGTAAEVGFVGDLHTLA